MNPKLRPEVQFFSMGSAIFHVYDPSTGKHYKMGEQEVGWLKLTRSSTSTGSGFTEAPVDVRGFATRFGLLLSYAPSFYSDGVAFVIQGAGPTDANSSSAHPFASLSAS